MQEEAAIIASLQQPQRVMQPKKQEEGKINIEPENEAENDLFDLMNH